MPITVSKISPITILSDAIRLFRCHQWLSFLALQYEKYLKKTRNCFWARFKLDSSLSTLSLMRCICSVCFLSSLAVSVPIFLFHLVSMCDAYRVRAIYLYRLWKDIFSTCSTGNRLLLNFHRLRCQFFCRHLFWRLLAAKQIVPLSGRQSPLHILQMVRKFCFVLFGFLLPGCPALFTLPCS